MSRKRSAEFLRRPIVQSHLLFIEIICFHWIYQMLFCSHRTGSFINYSPWFSSESMRFFCSLRRIFVLGILVYSCMAFSRALENGPYFVIYRSMSSFMSQHTQLKGTFVHPVAVLHNVRGNCSVDLLQCRKEQSIVIYSRRCDCDERPQRSVLLLRATCKNAQGDFENNSLPVETKQRKIDE